MSFLLCCTRCEGPLRLAVDSYACDRCSHRIALRHGVLWVSTAEPPPLLPLARAAREGHWVEAARARLEARGLGARDLMSRLSAVRTERAGDWHFLVDSGMDGAALIMGDRWGAHMAGLSRAVREVVLFEQDPEAAEFLRARADQESLQNVRAIVCGGSVADFPFTRAQFSLVALMGAWTREESRNGQPDALEDIVQAAFRLLVKGGTFVLGISNRWRFPRAWRDLGHARLAGTVPSIRARLSRSGFHDLRFYLSQPDIDDIQALVSLDSKVALRYFHLVYRHPRARWKRVLLGAAIDAGLIAVAAPSYIAIAKKP